MQTWAIIIAVILIATLLAVIGEKSRKKIDDKYKRRSNLLSPAERSFHGVLKQALAAEYEIFAKIRVADVIEPAARANWQRAFNKISSKHIDFILCDKNTMQAILAIELDDKSHNSDKSIKRDSFLNSAMQSANLPLLRIPAAKGYNIESIKSAAIVLIKN